MLIEKFGVKAVRELIVEIGKETLGDPDLQDFAIKAIGAAAEGLGRGLGDSIAEELKTA